MNDIARACPECGHRLTDGAVLCTHCGHDLRAHRRAGVRLGAFAQRFAVRGRTARLVVAWALGLAMTAVLVGTLVAGLKSPGAATVYLWLVIGYVALAWITGFVVDLRRKGLFAALLWFAPFGGRTVTMIGTSHELVAERIHHRNPILEAIFINAALALLSLLVVMIARVLF